MRSSNPARNKDFYQSLLIFGYIAAVLLISGLARADVGLKNHDGLRYEVAPISNSKTVLAQR